VKPFEDCFSNIGYAARQAWIAARSLIAIRSGEGVSGGVRSVMNSARRLVHWLLTVTAFVAVDLPGLAGAVPAASTQAARAVGPALTVVHQFGDDFHLVGISVSKTGRVFATAPTARVRSGLSMVEVDTRTGQITPYPDAAWNTIRPEADGKPEWGLVQAL
jgi:hypothetical protein